MSRHRHEMACTAIQKPGGLLPAGYTRLEYVTSNNTIQGWIDTRIIPEITDYIQIDVYRRNMIAPFGADNFVIAASGSDEHWRVFSKNGVYADAIILYKWQQYIYKDGSLLEPKTHGTVSVNSGGINCTGNLFLFRRYTIEQYVSADIAYCKIEKANGYVKELIPAIRNSDGMVGMYDIANNYFHVPSGGYLIAGPTI